MKIDRTNYELYVIDFLEGQLSHEATEAMRRFLNENPELASEIAEMQPIIFTDENAQGIINKQKYFKKFSDLQEINSENIEELCIAYFENDLNLEMNKRLRLFLSAHPEARIHFDIYAKVRFTADLKIQFPKRYKLVKRSVINLRRVAGISITIAAASLLFIHLYTKEIRQNTVTPIMQANSDKVNQIVIPENLLQKEEVMRITTPKEDKKIPADKLLAPFDTNNSQQNEKLRLAQNHFIQPEKAPSKEPNEVNSIDTPVENGLPQVHPEEPDERIKLPVDKINSKTGRRKLLVGALKAGIKGINKLTENNMAIHTELNNAGDFREIELRSGNFEFERKNSNNIKNN